MQMTHWSQQYHAEPLISITANIEKAYIDNLNSLIEGTEFEELPLEEIIRDSKGALFNNASQAWNHIFYFFSFSPDGGGEPEGELREAIDKQFGSFDNFKKEFVDAGVKLFGSGWVWLSRDNDGKLFITQESNAGNPHDTGADPHTDIRCLGTCLLPRLPEPTQGCPGEALGYHRLAHRRGSILKDLTTIGWPNAKQLLIKRY